MAIKTIITCDVCGTEKKETNKWWVVFNSLTEFSISPWHSVGAHDQTNRAHVCSRRCIQKRVESWMETVEQ